MCEINATGKRIEEAVEEIASVLERKGKCRVGVVDRLGKLDREERLHDFLKDF